MFRGLLAELRQLGRMCWPMTFAVCALAAIGVIFIHSACYISEDTPARGLYQRQIVWVLAGAGAFLFFAAVDYRHLRRWSWWAYALSVALLVLVLLVGKRTYGARRWLTLFGEGGVGLQPSELAKLAAVLLLARRLSRPGDDYAHPLPVLQVLALLAAPMFLVLKQPDLGTALIFLPVLFVLMFVAGVPLRTLGILAGAGLAVAVAVLAVVVLPERLGMSAEAHDRALRAVGLSPYHKERIMVFFEADRDPLGTGWNKRQSVIAVGSGGAWGKGYLKGTQNVLGFLPRSVAPTDFIYSVIAEEMGFAGSLTVLGLYAVVVGCGMHAAATARDRFGRLICAGVSTLFFCHCFINLAMTVGLMPITGLPLPLLSYGGTFMLVVMSALGMVQSVFIRSREVGAVYEQARLWQSA